MTLNAGLHLGQLLKDKLMENSNDNVLKDIITNQSATITQLTTELDAAKARVEDLQNLFAQSQTKARETEATLENQRDLTRQWHSHCDKISPLYEAVKEAINDIIYGDCFKEHIEHIAQERVDIALQQDVGIDYLKLNDHIDYDRLASKIDLGELASDHIDMGDLASHVASEIDTSDVACELDLSEIAGHIDVSDVADNVSCSDIASELTQRVRVNVDFHY